MIEWLMNEELEKMWNGAVMTYFKVLTRPFPEETEETHEILSQYSLWPGQGSKRAPPEYM